ncbi:ankyrin [Trematosphaeria pertusa]|uniref:Ankyrin n=1 Tax=Trematosphaeria pertusa TaxID=390896 RepID=A0A6A6IEP9_9PLEO|nr:ankyrin [Trematosphaeria pertusa]KAF2248891.1 ankyrin [Trematosphaeria pertusa]
MNPFLRTHDACLEHYLSGNRRAFMARFGSTLLEVEDSTVGFRDADLEQLSVERFTERLSSGIHDIDILYEHGNTSLTLVSKFGITDTTHLLLDKGASAALPDADGSTPLHWLFMYPPEDLQNIAFRLTNERDGFVFPGDIDDKIHVPSAINHVVPFASPINLDPQLPIQLSGTPLAFAVFVHCKKSVKALLQLGADPLLGLPVAGQEGQAGSALAVAFCLHMADILELLLEHLVTCGFPATALLRLLDGLQRTLPAANLQRALIHGCHMQSAAEATITVLLDYYRYAGREPQKWDILKPAAKNLHPLLCRAIVKAMDGGRAQGTLTEENLAELMFICMSGACRSGRDLTAAIEMLELAMRIGSSINYQYQGHAVDRTPLFMAIDRHDGDLLDWMLENTDVDVAVADKDGLTALHRIIKSGFSSTYDIRKLINKDQGLPNRRCLAGNAPIDLVTSDLQLEVFKALLPYSPTESRYKLLEAAIIADAPKLVTANLEALHMKTIPNLINMNTALSVAAQMASGEVAEILISFGANPKSATASGYSTIHEACLYGNIDVLDLCIKLEHDVNLESSQGTPLLIATTTLIENDERSTGARACADALLDAGANPSYMDSDKRTPLAFLLEAPMYVRTKHTALIKKLLEKGADPNEGRQSPLLEYSLTKAIREEDFELAEVNPLTPLAKA